MRSIMLLWPARPAAMDSVQHETDNTKETPWTQTRTKRVKEALLRFDSLHACWLIIQTSDRDWWKQNDHLRTAFEPALSLTEVKTWRTFRAYVSPAAFITVRARLSCWSRSAQSDVRWSYLGVLTAFNKITWCFFGIYCQRPMLFRSENIIMRVLARCLDWWGISITRLRT